MAYIVFLGGYPTSGTHEVIPYTLDKSTFGWLQYINKILLLMESYFALMYIYNAFKHHEQHKKMSLANVLLFRVIPLVPFPFGFMYLFASLHFLSIYPTIETISLAAIIAGYVYVMYLIYA